MAAVGGYLPLARRPCSPPLAMLSVPCQKGGSHRPHQQRHQSHPLSNSSPSPYRNHHAGTTTGDGRTLMPVGDRLSPWQRSPSFTRSTTRLAQTFSPPSQASLQGAPSCHDRHRAPRHWSRCAASSPSAAGRGATAHCGSDSQRITTGAIHRIHVPRHPRPRRPSSHHRRSRQCVSGQTTSHRCLSFSS